MGKKKERKAAATTRIQYIAYIYSLSGRFALPDDADESSIPAKLKDGVVTISIGKAAPSAPRIRHIPVSSLADGSGVPPSPHADAAGTAGPGETPQQHDGDTTHADA